MAIKIDSLKQLQEYFQGVIGRTHHAPNVSEVALPLLGAIIWRSDGDIVVREYAGRPANMIWFQINTKQYLMKYDHSYEQIELLDRTSNTVLYTFDNSVTVANVISIFNSL